MLNCVSKPEERTMHRIKTNNVIDMGLFRIMLIIVLIIIARIYAMIIVSIEVVSSEMIK